MTPIDQMDCRILLKRSRYEGQLTPVTLDKPVLIGPGSMGGVNWKGIFAFGQAPERSTQSRRPIVPKAVIRRT